MKNYYEILGVSRNADGREIRRSYLKKVKENHPDQSGDFPKNNISEINEAYSILKDSKLRLEYNIQLDFKTNSLFHDKADYYFPSAFASDLLNEKTYKRVMIFLWVVLGFVASMLIFTLSSFNDLKEVPQEENSPFELRPNTAPEQQDIAPKEIYHIREI